MLREIDKLLDTLEDIPGDLHGPLRHACHIMVTAIYRNYIDCGPGEGYEQGVRARAISRKFA